MSDKGMSDAERRKLMDAAAKLKDKLVKEGKVKHDPQHRKK